MSETMTLDEYRTGYISERHGVSDNCARALQLFEIGFSASGAAKHLGVSESTAKGYMNELTEVVGESACWSAAGEKPTLDVWGDRSVTEYATATYSDGVADAKSAEEASYPATSAASQLDPSYRTQPPRNKGVAITDIPTHLISLGTEVDV